MPQLMVEGRSVELSHHDFLEYMLGHVYAASRLGGILGGYFDTNVGNDRLLKKQSDIVCDNISQIDDQELRALFELLNGRLLELMDLDQQATERIAEGLRLPLPTTEEEYRTLREGFEQAMRARGAQAIGEMEELGSLVPIWFELAASLLEIRLRVVDRIATIHPDLLESGYIDPRDRQHLTGAESA